MMGTQKGTCRKRAVQQDHVTDSRRFSDIFTGTKTASTSLRKRDVAPRFHVDDWRRSLGSSPLKASVWSWPLRLLVLWRMVAAAMSLKTLANRRKIRFITASGSQLAGSCFWREESSETLRRRSGWVGRYH